MKVDTQDVYLFFTKNPNATQSECASFFGCTRQLIARKLKELEAVGAVRRTRQWRSVRPVPGAVLK